MKRLKMAVALGLLAAWCGTGRAYMVGPALSLDKLAEQADVIVKAKVLSSALYVPLQPPLPTPGGDPWRLVPGFSPYRTEMLVISVTKGDVKRQKVIFQHYGRRKDLQQGANYQPQFYDFEVGRTYLVFAKAMRQEGMYQQLWRDHKAKEDQGVILAADESPVTAGRPIGETVWAEMDRLLSSKEARDVSYAIRQLDEMSGGQLRQFGATQDFEREKVLERVHGFVAHGDAAVAGRAIRAVGAASPYLRDEDTAHWLATVGGGKIPGIGLRDKNVQNAGARKYWRELASVADGKGAVGLRALAIRALGRSGEPKVAEALPPWLKDPEPLVRQAAAVLLADFPGGPADRSLNDLALDRAPEVRVGAARAVGFGQMSDRLALLERLLKDEDINVRTAAALSLVSFAPAQSREVLKANLNDPDFKSVFVNALAEEDPAPYLDQLAEVIEKPLEPHNFWGGRIPAARSWDILFGYVKARGDDQLKSGKLDRCLAALENAQQFYGSGEPRDLYEFYRSNGMDQQATRFRERCKKTIRFDMEYYFNQVDEAIAAERAKPAPVPNALWKRRDAFETNLTWYGIKDGLAVADAGSGKVVRHERLFDYDAFTVNGMAFEKEKVWVGTDKGLMAWDRKGRFWSRVAVDGTMIEVAVRGLSITDEGQLRVAAGEKGEEKRFEYDLKSKKWQKLP